MHAESSRLARVDALDGDGNRRALDEWLLAHPQGPATLVMVDLDEFKDVNDTYVFLQHPCRATARRGVA